MWRATHGATSSTSNACGIPWRRSAAAGRLGRFSSRAASIFLLILLAPSRTPSMVDAGERLTVFAFAAFVVLAIVGLAFAVGYLIGRIFL